MSVAKPASPAVATLEDVYTSFKAAPHSNAEKAAMGLKNEDRSPTDLKTYERSLRYVAVASTGGVDHLELCPADALDVNPQLLEQKVHKGAELLALREKKAPPSLKTLQNAVSCCKAMQRTAFGKRVKKSAQQRIKERPKRKNRDKFSYDGWPHGLLQQWDAYAEWKSSRHLPENEKPYRKKVCRPKTMKANRCQVNPYVGYLVRERGMTEIDLLNLAHPDTFRAFLNAYFNKEADGGYKACKNLAVQLAQICQYLVAKGQLPEKNKLGRTPWSEFYEIGNDILKDGAEQGELHGPKDIGTWKPDDLLKIAEQAWDMPQSENVRGSHSPLYQKQFFNRRRTALFFFMAFDTPLRHRNWIEMRWGKHLFQNPLGLWEVYFEGQELKVGSRQYVTNVYHQTYSESTSRMIDAWRVMLVERFGPNFEQHYPYVFTAWQHEGKRPKNQLAPNTFHYHVNHLVMELRGELFHPHKIRHIVASHLVNEFGPKGAGLAAELLGDTINVVMATYFRPNNEEALLLYRKGR